MVICLSTSRLVQFYTCVEVHIFIQSLLLSPKEEFVYHKKIVAPPLTMHGLIPRPHPVPDTGLIPRPHPVHSLSHWSHSQTSSSTHITSNAESDLGLVWDSLVLELDSL